jgi:signal transduction histidine kinase
MLRARQAILAAGLVAVAALALVGISGQPEAGAVSGLDADLIVRVDPGSPVWRAGIRAGDKIVELDDSRSQSGWRLETTDGVVTREVLESRFTSRLTGYTEWAIVAMVGALVLAYFVYRGIRPVGLLLPVAFAIAAQPLFYAGHLFSTIVAGVAVYFGGSQALAAFAPPESRFGPAVRAAAAIGLALAIGWVVAVMAVPALFDPLDAARWPIAIGLTVCGLALITDWRRPTALVLGSRGPTFLDLAFLGGTAALAAGLILLVGLPLLAVIVGVVIIAVAYPVWRRALLGGFDRLVTSSARREAAARAVEAERGRLARDVHDVPIQVLAGVIRKLETEPGKDTETRQLRGVAEWLRDMASDLRPPVLDDLGLGAAIEDFLMAVREDQPDWVIEAAVDDLTDQGRPPADVELAAFRILQGAVGNAVAHSGGQRLVVAATIAAETVLLRVADDGQGYDPAHLVAARRAGHFGIDAMRERAEAIGGIFSTQSSSTGVAVDFRWTR